MNAVDLAVPGSSVRPTGPMPETPEAVGLALLYLILEQDRSLTSRTSNQPVAAYILDLYAECLAAVTGDRRPNRDLKH